MQGLKKWEQAKGYRIDARNFQIIDARNFHLLCQLLDVDFTKNKGRNLKNKISEFTS